MGEEENSIFPIEEALEMVLVFGQDGIISYANASARKKLGYEENPASEDGLRGRRIREVFPGVSEAPGEESGEPDFRPGTQCNLVAYRRNRTCFPVEAKVVESGAKPGIYICMANDILEKEHLGREIGRVREEARQAARVKSEFVANVTHELRTPVNGILGNVRELLEEAAEPRTVKVLQLVEHCCGDMNKIINNILDFSKLEAGKFTLEYRKFHLRNMLDYVKEQHRSKITEKGLDFFMTVSPQVPEYVKGDELRITQILNNLLSNALKFTAVGKITVQVLMTARVEDKIELFFIVADTGIGIEEEDADRLFESFTQADASISRKYGGTGLGLNICRQLAELMGGRIQVESEKEKGSIFSFSVWVESCGEEEDKIQPPDDIKAVFRDMALQTRAGEESRENIKKYGTGENREALKRNLSKLILCIEMENWEKAETFMETIRQLTEEAPPETKRGVLRLKMAIQKENYDKTAAAYEELTGMI